MDRKTVKKSDTRKPTRQLIRTTIEKKKEVVATYGSGVGATDNALLSKMPRATILMKWEMRKRLKQQVLPKV